MKSAMIKALALLVLITPTLLAQRGQKSSRALDVPKNDQAIGEAGVAWYTTWEQGLAEAKRSQRPIFFMSAAATCSGVPGVF